MKSNVAGGGNPALPGPTPTLPSNATASASYDRRMVHFQEFLIDWVGPSNSFFIPARKNPNPTTAASAWIASLASTMTSCSAPPPTVTSAFIKVQLPLYLPDSQNATASESRLPPMRLGSVIAAEVRIITLP